jgi:hypothetical protein
VSELLTDEYLEECKRRAMRYQGQWTGTAGSLAADSRRLQLEREVLVSKIDRLTDENAGLRAALDGGCCDGGKCHPQVEAMESAWAAVKARHQAMHERIAGVERDAADSFRLIGITGRAGVGKTLVAGMIPGAVVLQLADPLYAMLSVMLGIPEQTLRARPTKEAAIDALGKSPRQLLQLLGTEWGRHMVGEDVWVRLADQRVQACRQAGAKVVAVADVRFDNEARHIRDRGGEVWCVRRSSAGPVCQHSSESGVSPGLIDHYIDNDSGFDALQSRVAELLAAGRP